jgi:hypothetical protein
MAPTVEFSLLTFTCMLLLRLTSPRHRDSPDYDYMLCPCVSGVRVGIAMQVSLLFCRQLPLCIARHALVKHPKFITS